jgi:hypothetical protein
VVAILALTLICACGAQSPSAASASPVPSPISPIVSAAVDGDTLTLTFNEGNHDFSIKPEPSSHFFGGDGRGTWVDVAGTVAAEITLTGFRGDVLNYTGPASIKSQGPLLLEAREVSEFEGYVKWAVGLSGPACAKVTPAGSALAFHFVAAPKAGCPAGALAA